MMGDQTAKVRVAAVIALGRLGEDGVKIDTLVKLLNPKKNSTDLVRVAIELLSKRTGKAGKALDAIIKCLEIKDLNVRVWAVWAIGLLGGKNKDALAAVEPLTIEPHPRIQSWSAASLAHLTEKAEVVMPVVQRVLICREEDTRRGVLAAITKLGKKAMPTLLSCTANVNPRIRQQACVVMGELRDFTDDTKAVLDRLAEKDHDEDVRNAAIEAKKKLSEPLKTLVEPLVPASR